MWFIALAFLGVGTVSAQTETAEVGGQAVLGRQGRESNGDGRRYFSMDERRKFRVETDPSKFDKLGCRW